MAERCDTSALTAPFWYYLAPKHGTNRRSAPVCTKILIFSAGGARMSADGACDIRSCILFQHSPDAHKVLALTLRISLYEDYSVLPGVFRRSDYQTTATYIKYTVTTPVIK